jgi:peptidoglycan-associated lipoprotein
MKKLLMFATVFALAAGCSQKQVAETENNEGAAPVTDVSAYSSQGSDYNQAGDLKSVVFDYDKSAISNTAKEILKKNAAYLKTNPSLFVQIEGHCDNRGTIEYNLALGERRAITVKKYLVGLGIDSKRLSTISYGEEKLLCSDETDNCWGKNRRANFVIISK